VELPPEVHRWQGSASTRGLLHARTQTCVVPHGMDLRDRGAERKADRRGTLGAWRSGGRTASMPLRQGRAISRAANRAAAWRVALEPGGSHGPARRRSLRQPAGAAPAQAGRRPVAPEASIGRNQAVVDDQAKQAGGHWPCGNRQNPGRAAQGRQLSAKPPPTPRQCRYSRPTNTPDGAGRLAGAAVPAGAEWVRSSSSAARATPR